MLNPKDVISNPYLFSLTFLKILDKSDKLIPFKWNKAQLDFHNKKTGRDLVLKARQLGISTYEQADIFRNLITKTTRAMTLSHDDTTTQILRQTADRFYSNCSFNDIKPLRKYANATMATYPDFDSTHIIGTAGNTEVGRGGSYSRIHGSEVSKWKDAERIIAGAMQGGNPDVVLESTPNGAQGFFYEKCMEALSGDSIWKLHFYSWWWDENYRLDGEPITLTDEEKELCNKHNLDHAQIRWRRNKQKELGRLFIQEYPEDPVSCFLTSGNSYFGDLSNVFTAPSDAVYNPEHEYVAGLDFGQSDYTALSIFDKTIKQQVDLLHINKLEWAEQRARIKQKYKYWHLSAILAENNSIGSPNIEALRNDGVRIIPFDTTNESKASIMSEMYEALHNGWKLLNHPVQKHEFYTFVSTQLPSGIWRLSALGEGHDDTVIASALGIRSAKMALSMPNNQPTQKSKFRDNEVGGWKKF